MENKKVANMIQLYNYNNERLNKKAKMLHLAIECKKE